MNDFYQSHIILENDIIKLIPFNEKYENDLRQIIFDKEITKFTGNHIVSDQDLKNYINSTLKSRNEKISYPFIVIDKASGQVAGSTRFGNILFHSKRLEIGWTWYGDAFRGKGINKASKFELLRYAFEEMDFNRVQFSVDIENIRSQKAVLRIGAKQEGVFRNNYINAKGDPRDDVYFSIIKSEWPDIKSTVFSEFTFD
ncbi:Protein N-acetyltransferase, RimJ/RimL family [Paenibacillus sp. 1_12]|uniref:GNAT family N-acetyltransferase n=1 Tax=Paenibacillus sp. 1_12 TaxID=1566278 RepID=UPI0008E65705|nr:GNAT family protein [Paenibacillus sp. 1_12]SFL26319.1 Protein N-acetyltransferase, RimJ/RimL family [Paenibacillus sp. 1_12]